MRDEKTPATLGEMMGKQTAPSSLKDLPELLGEKMPEIDYTELGRMRLLKALRVRFGTGFQNLPGIKGIINEFDTELKYNKAIKANRRK